MARSRFIPNLLYGTLGLVAAGAATYYAIRTLRRRREAGAPADEEAMLSVRRATRKAGRKVKQASMGIASGIEDTGDRVGDTIADAGNEFESPLNRV